MGRISHNDIEHLRANALEDVVASYVTLKRSGGRLKGLCPFPDHNESTPSFTVQPSEQLFMCFGCNTGGDVFSFVEAMHPGMQFPDVVREVARSVGYELTEDADTEEERQARAQRARILEANADASAFFTSMLLSDRGSDARAYLKGRGFDRDDVDRYGLGYAPKDRSMLVKHLSRQGHALGDIVAAGLIYERGRRSFFHDRLIIPIRQPDGRPIAFAGRIVESDDPFAVPSEGDDPFAPSSPPPKYINTAETPVYRKSDVLFGLDVARNDIRRRDEVLMVEGYTDVMGLAKVGYANVVATCGTAAGDGHMRVLSRFTQKLVLAFDGDDAGAGAVERAWRAAQRYGMNVRVLELTDGRDPAEFAAEEGTTGVEDAVRNAEQGFGWIVRYATSPFDLDTAEGRREGLGAAVALLGEVQDATLRDMYVSEVGEELGVTPAQVRQAAADAGIKLVSPARKRRADSQRRAAAGGVQLSGVRQHKIAVMKALWVYFKQPAWMPDSYWAGDIPADVFAFDLPRRVVEAAEGVGGAGTAVSAVVAQLDDDPDAKALIARVSNQGTYEDLSSAEDADALFRGLLMTWLEQQQTQMNQRLLHADEAEQLEMLGQMQAMRKRIEAIKGR